MLQAPINNILVKVDTKFIGNYTNIIKAANLNPGTQINPADLVNIVGEVVSVPKMVTTNKRGYEGFSVENVKVGDKAIFRYDVIYEFDIDAEKDETFYKNSLVYKGREYFRVDVQKLFAVIRDGDIIMQNGYCMIENMEKPAMIVLPQHLTNIRKAAQATLSQIGHPLKGKQKIAAKQGDTVFYNPTRVQEYSIRERKFGILRMSDILGIAEFN